MPSLSDHKSQQYRKLLLLGSAKVGKTTSLVSLVKAGFELGIIDLDNLLDSFAAFCRHECPALMKNVDARTVRDKMKMTQTGPMIDGPAKAFPDAIKMIDRWKYDDVDWGVPGNWGANRILVIDSLSRFCDAAYDWAEMLTPKGKSGMYDDRAVYRMAQEGVEKVLATITSPTFETNVIVICHGMYLDEDGKTKIFPQGVGQKLSPKIPQYFPAYVRYTNDGGKRRIQLKSTPLIDLANPDPFTLTEDSLPAETGLATIFGRKVETTPSTQPKQLKRA